MWIELSYFFEATCQILFKIIPHCIWAYATELIYFGVAQRRDDKGC